jgi:hypothetical protein
MNKDRDDDDNAKEDNIMNLSKRNEQEEQHPLREIVIETIDDDINYGNDNDDGESNEGKNHYPRCRSGQQLELNVERRQSDKIIDEIDDDDNDCDDDSGDATSNEHSNNSNSSEVDNENDKPHHDGDDDSYHYYYEEEAKRIEEEEMEEARRRVIKNAMGSIWWEVNFNDGCALLNLLYPIRQQLRSSDNTPVNLADFLCWFTEDIYGEDFLDSNGRRTKSSFRWTVEPFDLPSIIEYLPKLKEIKLGSCRSFTKEISHLPSLEKLDLSGCEEEFFHQPLLKDLRFDSLKSLVINDGSGFLSPLMLDLITNRLPVLEELQIYINYGNIVHTLNALRNKKNVLQA